MTYNGELLSRRLVGECGYALYALHMDTFGRTLDDDARQQVLLLCHALANVVRAQGSKSREFSRSDRVWHMVELQRALDSFWLDKDRVTYALTSVVLFRVRWALHGLGVYVRLRSTPMPSVPQESGEAA